VLQPAAAAAIATTDTDVMLEALEHPAGRFGAGAVAKRDRLLLDTLAAAWRDMERLQGPDSARWQWGALHVNLSVHPFSAAVDAAQRARIDVGPLPRGGSEFTPNQSVARADDFRETSGPSVRLLVDVGNWDGSRAVNHPGQSGDPDSPHYRDLAPLWRSGAYFPLAYTRPAVERVTERVIRLLPAAATQDAALR
jgi:penicillin amidase